MSDKDVFTIDVGSLWTGRRGQVIREARVVVKAGRIVTVGAKADFGDAQSADLEYPNGFMLPGLIDVHLHLVFGEQGRSYEEYIREDATELMLLRSVRNIQVQMAAGVTTMRDCGGPDTVTLSLKEGLNKGYIEGPRLLISGRPLTVTGGHFWWCNEECDGVDGVRRAARRLIKDGVDFFKIMASGGGSKGTDPKIASFTADEIRAATDVARDHGMMTTAHCEATTSIERAIEGGIHCIEHAGFQEPDGTRTYRQDLVDRMSANGIYYSPTIQTAFRGIKQFVERPNLTSLEQKQYDAQKYKLARKLSNLEKMFKAGVQVIYGTDSIGQFGDFATGLELFCHCCMTTEEALISATSLAATAIGLGHEIGTIEVGKSADLVVVAGNPLEDISALRRVVTVFSGGRPYRCSRDVRSVDLPLVTSTMTDSVRTILTRAGV